MKKLCYTLLPALLLVQSCNQGELYNQRLKTIDSLNGALNLKVRELEKTDTALLQRCLTRFDYYRQFIKQTLSDTIGKAEADNLQHFFVAGKNLESFKNNRLTILARASLSTSQQARLAQDIKNHAIEIAQADQYIARETEAATQLINTAATQQQTLYRSLEEFKTALPGVESLIRAANNGQLPTIVKDTLSI